MTVPKKILVPIDFSDCSTEALVRASELARTFDAKIVLLHVYELPSVTPNLSAVFSDANTLTRITDGVKDALGRLAAPVAEQLGRSVGTWAVEGRPAEAITRVASEGQFDLIVMGTHGRTGLMHLVIGSVAERVVRTALCPVLTVRAPKPARVHAA